MVNIASITFYLPRKNLNDEIRISDMPLFEESHMQGLNHVVFRVIAQASSETYHEILD